jgi:NNP family nitrate/nitrite transporter-like MFS transporter
MGVMMMVALQLLLLLSFPAWGGMLQSPQPGASEEAYYVAEYTVPERARGVHLGALKFAQESRSQRPRSSREAGAGGGAGGGAQLACWPL